MMDIEKAKDKLAIIKREADAFLTAIHGQDISGDERLLKAQSIAWRYLDIDDDERANPYSGKAPYELSGDILRNASGLTGTVGTCAIDLSVAVRELDSLVYGGNPLSIYGA